MTSRDKTPASSRLPHANEGPARSLRDNLAGVLAGVQAGSRRERLQFRCLKRLSLPRHSPPPRLAPNI
jgi:hypothetical protein